MTTGDLKNNLRKLVSELKQVDYPQSELDLKGIAQGIPKAFLPALHHVFLDYSILLAQHFASKEYELYGKTDLRFLEAVYKVLRDEFGYKPQVTKEQFLTIGFAERKIISLCEILKLLREKHDELKPKSSKSEKKKGKSSQHTSFSGSTAKEMSSVNTASSDYFPGPLPVDTDMKSFQSNKEAMEAGLGLKEPLVTRMKAVETPNIEGNIKACSEKQAATGSLTNSEQLRKTSNSVDDSVPSNFVVKTTCDEARFGVKFPVSRNSEIRSNLCRHPQVNTVFESSLPKQPQIKTVTWEDQVIELQDRQTQTGRAVPHALPLSHEPVAPVSILAKTHEIPYSGRSPAYHPMELETTVGMKTMPHTIPTPVSMMTAPMPSPDLMLTPIVKSSQREVIPLSSLHEESDFYSAPVGNVNLPSTRVVRHSNSLETVSSGNAAHSSSNMGAEAEFYFLRQQVQELQQKFDFMVLLNNEMSARVVLLESRMKLLEEACEKKSCNCKSPSPSNNKETTSRQDDRIVVSGFNVDKGSVEQFSTAAATSGNINNHDENLKSGFKHNSTSRKLFKETVTLPDNGDHEVKVLSHDTSPFISEKSDEEESDGTENNCNTEHTADKSKSVSLSDRDDNIIIRPIPSVSKLSKVFSDSSTKNTVMNVHKRLQETRELLARTNRDFAAKFNSYQIE